MAKKSVKKIKKSKTKTSSKIKGYRGLKNYVVIGLVSVVAIAVIIFAAVWNNISENATKIGIVTLPETGVTQYYTNCLINNADGVVGYADGSTQKCVYLGPKNDDHNYETATAYLRCTANDLLLLNVCTEGRLK